MQDLRPSTSHAAALVSFSASLGISPDKCLAEAIQDWLDIVAPARLEEVYQNDKSSHIIALCERKTG